MSGVRRAIFVIAIATFVAGLLVCLFVNSYNPSPGKGYRMDSWGWLIAERELTVFYIPLVGDDPNSGRALAYAPSWHHTSVAGFSWSNPGHRYGIKTYWLAIIPAIAAIIIGTPFPRHGPKHGRCPRCSYDCRATPGRCSECGWVMGG